MDYNRLLLTLAAILPAAVLCIYIFKKDRAEKEPLGLLALLLGLGVAICYPAALAETVLDKIIDTIFIPFATETENSYELGSFMFRIYNGVKYFLNVALVEEGFKFAALVLVTRKNKNFNSLFDGIIYAVFVSLGFAGFENILYVTNYGWINAATRAVMSVPAHMFFSVMMGYYYSMWHMKVKARNLELNLKQYGVIPQNAPLYTYKKDIVMCLLVPILAHGLYDYCCTVDSGLATLVFYGFLIFMYIYCFGKVKKMSSMDMDDNRFASAMVAMKHPSYRELLRERNNTILNEQAKQQAYAYSQQTQYTADPRYDTPAPAENPVTGEEESFRIGGHYDIYGNDVLHQSTDTTPDRTDNFSNPTDGQ